MSRYQKLARRVRQRAFREQHPEYYTEYQRTYYLSRKHKCADCDNLCAPNHERCVQCENRRRHAVHAYPET